MCLHSISIDKYSEQAKVLATPPLHHPFFFRDHFFGFYFQFSEKSRLGSVLVIKRMRLDHEIFLTLSLSYSTSFLPTIRQLTLRLDNMIATTSRCSASALRATTSLSRASSARISAAASASTFATSSHNAQSRASPSAPTRSISTSATAQSGSSTRTAPPASTQLSPLQSPHSYLLEELAKSDQPSYLAHHFYPKHLQTHYAAIRTFNVEIAGLKDTVSNELLGRMRMGWWRDAVQGAYQVSLPSML